MCLRHSACLVLLALSTLQVGWSYKFRASVVEYYKVNTGSPEEDQLTNLNNYLRIIRHLKGKSNLVVFPEVGLKHICPACRITVPHNFSNFTGHKVLGALSEAAVDADLYLVVNIQETSLDKEYNTNLVFAPNGSIVARYRKYFLFLEALNQPPVPEQASFTTSWGVEFGLFTCFDLLFKEPVQRLLERGVRHFVFPTAWYSNIPFLAAVQAQMSWSWGQDAVLLAAGLNSLVEGHSGSGIYLGRNGTLGYVQGEAEETRIISATISDDPSIKPDAEIEDFPPAAPKDKPQIKLQLLKEYLSGFTLEPLWPEGCTLQDGSRCISQVLRRVCNHGWCCDFNLTLSYSLCPEPCKELPILRAEMQRWGSQDLFSYFTPVLAVFDGVRSYHGAATLGEQVCSLITCPDPTDTTSCGRPATSQVFSPRTVFLEGAPYKVIRYKIQRAEISAYFDTRDSLVSPTVHLENPRQNRTFFGMLSYGFNLTALPGGKHTLKTEGETGAGTLGIFARVYSRDGQLASSGAHSACFPITFPDLVLQPEEAYRNEIHWDSSEIFWNAGRDRIERRQKTCSNK